MSIFPTGNSNAGAADAIAAQEYTTLGSYDQDGRIQSIVGQSNLQIPTSITAPIDFVRETASRRRIMGGLATLLASSNSLRQQPLFHEIEKWQAKIRHKISDHQVIAEEDLAQCQKEVLEILNRILNDIRHTLNEEALETILTNLRRGRREEEAMDYLLLHKLQELQFPAKETKAETFLQMGRETGDTLAVARTYFQKIRDTNRKNEHRAKTNFDEAVRRLDGTCDHEISLTQAMQDRSIEIMGAAMQQVHENEITITDFSQQLIAIKEKISQVENGLSKFEEDKIALERAFQQKQQEMEKAQNSNNQLLSFVCWIGCSLLAGVASQLVGQAIAGASISAGSGGIAVTFSKPI